MDYGNLIRRAWNITWRYKALWVLGIFAGISGCQPGSGSPGSSNNVADRGGTAPGGFPDLGSFDQYLRIAVVALVALTAVGILWFLISVAAEAGLIHAVDSIERSGRQPTLGEAWGTGWRRWGQVFGVRFLLGIPAFVLGLMLAIVFVASFVPLFRGSGGDIRAAWPLLASTFGLLACGLPFILVIGVVTGLLRLTAVRYAVLGGRGSVEAIGAAWQALRARLKDHVVAYLISGVLNLAASFVLAIPMVIIAIVTVVPAFIANSGQPERALILGIGGFLLIAFALGTLYNAIWGTFTSAYWTAFFRDLTGMTVPAPSAYPAGPTGYPSGMPAPYAPAPPTSAYPPEPPAPPAAPYGPSSAAPYAPAPAQPYAPAPPAPSYAPPTPPPHAPAPPADVYPPAPPADPYSPPPPAPPAPEDEAR